MQKNKANIHSPLNQHKIITTKKILKLKKIKRRKINPPKSHNCNFGGNEFKNIKDKIVKNESNLENNSFQIINKDIKPISEEINILNNKSEKNITNINNKNNNITLLDDKFTNKKETLLSSPLPHIPSSPPKITNLDFSYNPSNLFSSPLFEDETFYKFFELEDMSLNDNLEIENFHNLFNPVLSEPIFDWNAFISENPPNNGSNNPLYNNYNSIRNEINPQNSNINNNDQNNNNNQRSNQNINNNNQNNNNNQTNNNNQRINQNNNNNRGSNQDSDNNIISFNSQDFFSFQFDILFDDSIFFSRRRRTNNNRIKIKNIKKKLNRIRFKKSAFSNENMETCIICYEDFKKNQNVYNLPCSHIFHVHCLNKEIKYRQKCPMCRKEL